MGILVYRDRDGKRDLAGRIEFDGTRGTAAFSYDRSYLERARGAGELGISELLPLDDAVYSPDEFGPFLKGLLPEGEVYGNLVSLYQVPRSDYLTLIEQMGCESIGALTFVSEEIDPSEYEPFYEPVDSAVAEGMAADPARMATVAASSTRLSLAGAQSKVAWFLPKGENSDRASTDGWLIPRGTAPSTHIVKISRKGEESIADNELACSLLARACGIETVEVHEVPDIPGAISVKRYDRVWLPGDGGDVLVRLHQEDFCQALGLAPFYKYQPQGVKAEYPVMAARLIESASENPQVDKAEFAKRLVFCYAVGNTDAHLKNFSLLYNRQWTGRRLAPFYDATCIPLTGYSTMMPFDIGDHRVLEDIDERDLLALALDLDIGLNEFDRIVREVASALDAPSISRTAPSIEEMIARIVDNSLPRVKVLKRILG